MTIKSNIALGSLFFLGAGMGVISAPARADRADTDEGGLEEIVVTAEKRESTVQHTPLDISVFSGTTLQNAGVEDFSSLYKIAPNVNVSGGTTGGIGSTVIAINGIRAYNPSPVTQSPIAVNLDGVYLARMSGLTGLFYDVTRMEVLAGPQGTLYGRNATGGAVNIITNQPGKEFGIYAEAEAGNYGESRFESAINLPISDSLSLRIAGRDFQHQGYFNNGLSDAHEDGGRVSALLNIASKATLSGSFDYETSDDHDAGLGLVGQRLVVNTSPAGATTVTQPTQVVAIPSNPYENTSVLYPLGRLNSTNNTELYGGKLQFDYDLDFANLTAITAYRSVKAFDLFLNPPSPLIGGAIGTQDFPAKSNTYSAEIRLASTATTPLQWVGGFYGFKENAVGPICVQGSYNNPLCVYTAGPNNDFISYAAFGQAIYTPPVLDDKLHLLVGGRYNNDEVTSSTFQFAVFPLADGGNFFKPDLNKDAQKGTYKLGVNYDLTADNLLYFSNSTGYRAFNFQFGTDPYVPPETIHAWEIGSKNEFLDKRLQVNVDAFWYDYYGSERSEQTYPPANLPFLPFGEITVYSAGHSRYKGVNFSVNAAITTSDHVNLSVQYIDARYINFVVPAIYKNTTQVTDSGVVLAAVGDYSGDPVSQVPPWAGTAAYQHDWSLFGGTFSARIDGQFATRQPMTDADPGTIEAVDQPGYAQGNVLLKYAANGNRWTVSAWCRNFSDKITWNSAGYGILTGTAGAGVVTAQLNPPRTFGVTVTAKVGNP